VWGDTTPAQRQLALFRIADAIEARGEELADIEVRDTGKPRSVFVSEEIPQSVDQIRFFAGAARNLEGKSTGEYMPDHTSSIRREPIGVIGQVTPWNYPFMMAVWKFAPALAAGNTIVIKPSDSTPASTLWLAELVSEFVPAGVMNVVLGDRETGGGLSLPVWISFMETALKNVPVMEPEPPEGIVHLNNEWYFEEFAKNAGVGAVGSGSSGQRQPLPAADEKKSILDLFKN
jgi:hypothetical protein